MGDITGIDTIRLGCPECGCPGFTVEGVRTQREASTWEGTWTDKYTQCLDEAHYIDVIYDIDETDETVTCNDCGHEYGFPAAFPSCAHGILDGAGNIDHIINLDSLPCKGVEKHNICLAICRAVPFAKKIEIEVKNVNLNGCILANVSNLSLPSELEVSFSQVNTGEEFEQEPFVICPRCGKSSDLNNSYTTPLFHAGKNGYIAVKTKTEHNILVVASVCRKCNGAFIEDRVPDHAINIRCSLEKD